MRQLSKLENILLRTGAVNILIGLASLLLCPYTALGFYAGGVLLFSIMMLRAEYMGKDSTLVRLRRQQMLGCFLLVISALLLGSQMFHLMPYLQHNEWLVALAIGAFALLYTAWRIPAELSKKKQG